MSFFLLYLFPSCLFLLQVLYLFFTIFWLFIDQSTLPRWYPNGPGWTQTAPNWHWLLIFPFLESLSFSMPACSANQLELLFLEESMVFWWLLSGFYPEGQNLSWCGDNFCKSLSLNFIMTYAYVKMIFPEDCFQIRMNCNNHFFYKINIKQ